MSKHNAPPKKHNARPAKARIVNKERYEAIRRQDELNTLNDSDVIRSRASATDRKSASNVADSQANAPEENLRDEEHTAVHALSRRFPLPGGTSMLALVTFYVTEYYARVTTSSDSTGDVSRKYDVDEARQLYRTLRARGYTPTTI